MTRRAPVTFLATLVALLVGVVALAGCGGGGSASPTPPKTAGVRAATVGVGGACLGKFLVDSRAHTLYLFKKDSGRARASALAPRTGLRFGPRARPRSAPVPRSHWSRRRCAPTERRKSP